MEADLGACVVSAPAHLREALEARADRQRERVLSLVDEADARRHARPPAAPTPPRGNGSGWAAMSLATLGVLGLAAAGVGRYRARHGRRRSAPAPPWTLVAAAAGAAGVGLGLVLTARAALHPRPLSFARPAAPALTEGARSLDVILPEVEGPAPRPVTRRGWFWAGAVALLLLVAVRVSLGPLMTHFTQKGLDSLTGYKGTFSTVHVSLLPMRLTITDLRLVEDGTDVKDAVLYIKNLQAQVAWGGLLQGRLVATAIADHAHFRILMGQTQAPPEVKKAAKEVAAEVKRNELNLGKTLEAVVPLRVDRFELRDSEVTLTDATDAKRPQFWIKDIEFVAENMVTRDALDENVPLLMTARATVQESGVLKLMVMVDLLATKPAFTGQAQLSGLNLESLYEWAAAKAGVSPHGKLDAFVNLNSAGGALRGEVKVMAHDVHVDALPGDLANGLRAAAANIAFAVLKDEKQGRVVATTLPLRGTLEQPDVQVWPAVLGVVRNAFVDSLAWGFGDLPIATANKKEGLIDQTVKGLDKKRPGPSAQPGGAR